MYGWVPSLFTRTATTLLLIDYTPTGASLVAQVVKNRPSVWETQVPSLGQEDPLEKGMATHSSFLAWRMACTEEPGGLQSMGLQRVVHDWATNTLTYTLIQNKKFKVREKKSIKCFTLSGTQRTLKSASPVVLFSALKQGQLSYFSSSTLKSRDVTLSTKVCLVKAMVFPVVMCGCES